MSDEIFLAAIIGPFYIVFGLSILFYAEVWRKIANNWIKDHYSLIGLMTLSLIFGLTIITMHNVWEWSPYLIITLTGWSAFLKATTYFLLPAKTLKGIIKRCDSRKFYACMGAVAIILGSWLSYLVYLA